MSPSDPGEVIEHPETLHLKSGTRWDFVDVPIRDANVLCVERRILCAKISG